MQTVRPSFSGVESVRYELGRDRLPRQRLRCARRALFRDIAVFLHNGRPGLGERRTRPRQRFQGTDRQVRGLVLNALRNLPEGAIALNRKSLERLWDDHIQLDRASHRWMRMVLSKSCRMRMCVFRYERKNADVLWMCAR